MSSRTAQRWLGRGASAGQATGPARVLRGSDDLTRCSAGEIVVMRHPTPALARLASQAAGLVCETGGVLNHLAILARELGTPCVTGVTGIVDALESGTRVTVDGTAGRVDTWVHDHGPTPGLVGDAPALPLVDDDERVPVLQFGRFSATFSCEEAVLTPEALVRTASFALLPAVLHLGPPLDLAFEGNRIQVRRRRLLDLAGALADRLETVPGAAEDVRTVYEEACAAPVWSRAAAEPGRALERFVLLNLLTWVAALPKEEIAQRLRRAVAERVPDLDVDEVLLRSLTTRGASYLLARAQARPAHGATLEGELSPEAQRLVDVLRHLVVLTEHKNTELARVARVMDALPLAATLGLAEDDLVDTGTTRGRAAAVRSLLAVLPRPELPL